MPETPTYEELVALHRSLTEKRIQFEAEYRAAERRKQEAEADAIAKCGTADPKALKALFDERTALNAARLAETTKALQGIVDALKTIDAEEAKP